MQKDQKLVSIERTVAFVLGPIVVAGSGTLSAWLSTKVGIKVSAPEITGAFATGGLAAGALAWKWLHGRQAYEVIEHDLGLAQNALGSIPGGDSFIKTTVKDLEGLAESAAHKAAAAVSTASVTSVTGQEAGGSSPPAADPIPPAADPAPTSQGQQAPEQAQVAQQADSGAATGS